MNNLSWLIYLANVCDNVGWMFSAAFIVSVFGLIGCVVMMFIMLDEGCSDSDWKVWRKCVFFFAPLLFFSTFLGAFIPNKETVYAIAASEMGETVLNSETGGKAVKALNHWLDKQIGDDEPAKKEEENKE